MIWQTFDKYITNALQTQYPMMNASLTKHQLKKIRDRLPLHYIGELTSRVNKDSRNQGKPSVQSATVQAVMLKERNDYYFIVDNAMKWGDEIEAEEKRLHKKTKLNKETV